jgi:hypothetical protein
MALFTTTLGLYGGVLWSGDTTTWFGQKPDLFLGAYFMAL